MVLSSRPVSHLHSSTTITLLSRVPASQRRATVAVRTLDGAQREQGPRRCRAAAADPVPPRSPSVGTNSELHWPKHSLLCTVTVSHPSAVTRCEDHREGSGLNLTAILSELIHVSGVKFNSMLRVYKLLAYTIRLIHLLSHNQAILSLPLMFYLIAWRIRHLNVPLYSFIIGAREALWQRKYSK